jgi:hypothetical protein
MNVMHARNGLVDMLSRATTIATAIDDGARMGQIPARGLVKNTMDLSRQMADVSLDIAAGGRHDIARPLGQEAVSVARRAGVMSGMNEERNAFNYAWQGEMRGAVDAIHAALRQLG